MKLFIDSASVSDIREAFAHGLVCGTTTNPSIVANERPHPQGYLGHLRDILREVPYAGEHPFSVQPPIEVLRESPREAVGIIKGRLVTRNLVVKIPMSWDNLPLIRSLSGVVPINVTCIFTAAQAVAAMGAGARYISLFWCRMNDASDTQADFTANLVRNLIDRSGAHCQIIAGSIRTADDAMNAFGAGCHIVTTGLPVLKAMANSDLSDASTAQFEEKRTAWDAQCESFVDVDHGDHNDAVEYQ